MSAADAMVPTTPQFATLKSVLARWDAAKAALEEAKAAEESLAQEAFALAKSIREGNIVDENFTLADTFCEGKSIEKVDNDRLKADHPEIFDRCNPHVDNHGGMAILKKAHGNKLQEMLKDMDPEMYREKATVTKADVKKSCTKAEYQMLESDGSIYTNVTYGGEIRLMSLKTHSAFQDALDAQRARFLPHADAEEDDD